MKRLVLCSLAGALLLVGGCSEEPLTVHYDLAPDAALAEWSDGDTRVVLSPAAQGGALLHWPAIEPRRAVLDIHTPEDGAGSAATIGLGDQELATLELQAGRHRYLVEIPEAAQRQGANHLQVVQENETGSEDVPAPSVPQLRAVSVGVAADPLPAWLAEHDVAPVDTVREAGIPSLLQAGPSLLSLALPLPEAAELRFTPERPRSGAGPARMRVTFQVEGGSEEELWTGQVVAGRKAEEVAVPLPGQAGDFARLRLYVKGLENAPGLAAWKAPRVMGRGSVERLGPSGPSPEDAARGEGLRSSLADASVLVILLGGVPAESLGCYGGSAGLTPEIDRLAGEGVLFEQAHSPATSTAAAMASLWTSQYPDRHHRGLPLEAPLPPQALTVADVVAAQGIDTGAFVAAAELGEASGLTRGFVDFESEASSAEALRLAAELWIGERQGRFLAYLHLPEAEAGFDAQVGALRQTLEAAGVWQRLLVILTSDHGSRPGERVPLVVRFPEGKGPSGKRVAELVDLLEVAPTIADAFGRLGKSGTDREFEGRSLLTVIDGAPGRGAVLARGATGYTLSDAAHQLVVDAQEWATLRSIDGEDLSRQPVRLEAYRQALMRWLRDLAREPGSEGTQTLSPEEMETLKALGYIS